MILLFNQSMVMMMMITYCDDDHRDNYYNWEKKSKSFFSLAITNQKKTLKKKWENVFEIIEIEISDPNKRQLKKVTNITVCFRNRVDHETLWLDTSSFFLTNKWIGFDFVLNSYRRRNPIVNSWFLFHHHFLFSFSCFHFFLVFSSMKI